MLLTPWIYHSTDGTPFTTSFFLSQGATPKGRDSGGWTLLHHAAVGGHVTCVSFLLTSALLSQAPYVLPVDGPAKDRSTPLLVAVTEGQSPEVVELLLRSGADPTLRNDKGESAVTSLTAYMQKYARKCADGIPTIRLNRRSRSLSRMATMVLGGSSAYRATLLRLRWQEEKQRKMMEEETEGRTEEGREKGVLRALVTRASDDVFLEALDYLDVTCG